MTKLAPEWNRLSPVSMIFFIFRLVSQLFKESLAGLAPLALLIANSDEKLTVMGLVLAGIGTLIIASSFLQYWFFQYKIDPMQILIHEGVFKKKHRTIKFERVQNINIVQPFYFRPFSLATLQVETAGSSGNEANLAGISFLMAETIKSKALTSIVEHTVQTEHAESPKILASASTLELVKYGLTSNNLFWFFVLLSPFAGKFDEIAEKWIGQENIEYTIALLGGDTLGGAILIAIIIVLITLVLILFSVLGAILRYHGYLLTEHGKTLKRISGLFSTHEESAKRNKIQATIRQTNFIGRWLNIENLIFKQASHQHAQQNNRRGLFVVPSRSANESRRLVQNIFETVAEPYQYHPIDKRYKIKTWLLLMLPVTLASLFLSVNWHWAASISWPIAGVIIASIVQLRWKKYRYALGEQFAFSQRGFLGYRKTEFPLFKAQRVIIKQSPLQRKRNLATLIVYLASERIQIPYMSMEHAEAWFNRISYQIETTPKNWY
jgi:putative membrane protein